MSCMTVLLELHSVLLMKCLPIHAGKLNIILMCVAPLIVPILRSENRRNIVRSSVSKCINFSNTLYYNTIFPSMPVSSKWYLPFRILDFNFVCISPIHATCPTHLILLDLIIIKFMVKSKNYEANCYITLHLPVTSTP